MWWMVRLLDCGGGGGSSSGGSVGGHDVVMYLSLERIN